jgi:acyl-CoA reductase-like NAD-dependent aldehyde dehydrogenase
MTWQSLTPTERGDICERIHRRLLAHQQHTEVALMHALGLPIDTIKAALVDMLKRGAVVKSECHGSKAREMWAAVPRSS